jgi:hypothetical protein
VADTLWQAGALEGWVAALETMVQWHLPLDEYVSSSSSVGVGRDLLSGGSKGEGGGAAAAKALLREVEEKVTEALTLLGTYVRAYMHRVCFGVFNPHSDQAVHLSSSLPNHATTPNNNNKKQSPKPPTPPWRWSSASKWPATTGRQRPLPGTSKR